MPVPFDLVRLLHGLRSRVLFRSAWQRDADNGFGLEEGMPHLLSAYCFRLDFFGLGLVEIV